MIYPIRVDVTSSDKAVHIIDTILIDPTCLPISPPVTHGYTDLQKETIINNAQCLANTLLADMEVQGLAKTGKAGRVLLLNNSVLVQQVEDQIHNQLKSIFDEEQCTRKKRRLNESNTSQSETANVSNSSSQNFPSSCTPNVDSKKEIDPKSKPTEAKDTNDKLIPIKIRLRENGICIADEFKVDPDHPMSNPIILAETMVKDMNLPERMSNSIAISIAEQMCGLDVPHDLNGWTLMEQVVSSNNPTLPTVAKRVPVNRLVPTAWKTEEKEENNFAGHSLNIGKPRLPSTRTKGIQ